MKIVAIIVGIIAFFIFIFGLVVFIVWGQLARLFTPSFNQSTGGVVVAGQTYATAYCPKKSEGGLNDRTGKPLQTLQQYLSGSAPYVSVAMDSALNKQYPYGTVIHIPALEKKYNGGKPIEFHFVDTGGSFIGTDRHPLDGQAKPRGLTAIDIATDCKFMKQEWQNMSVSLVFPGK